MKLDMTYKHVDCEIWKVMFRRGISVVASESWHAAKDNADSNSKPLTRQYSYSASHLYVAARYPTLGLRYAEGLRQIFRPK